MAYDLDSKDMKILEVLKQNSDYTTRKIAKKTLLPVTTVHNRIQKLKKEGILKRFTVDIDQKRMGKGLLVYVLISVSLPVLKKRKRSQYDVAKEMRKFDFVERVDIVGGGTDLVAMVRVKDVEEYDSVLLKKIQIIEGIDKTQSMIVIHEDK